MPVKRYAAYYRVSRSDLNLDNQRHAIKSLIPKGARPDEFVDEESGSVDTRLEWTRLKEAIAQGAYDAVYAYHVDRLGRSTIELCRFLDICEKAKATIVTPGMVIDPHDEMCRGFFQMAAIFAEMELRRIKRRTQDGLARAKAEGKHLGRRPALTKQQAEAAGEMLRKGIKTKIVLESTYLLDAQGRPMTDPTSQGPVRVARHTLYSNLRYWGVIKKSVKELRKENL